MRRQFHPKTSNEIAVNAQGGKGGRMLARFDLIDPHAMFKLGEVLHEGASKYAPDNWRHCPAEEHINHAIAHLYFYLGGDKSEDHLAHAQCRVHMAVAVAGAEDVPTTKGMVYDLPDEPAVQQAIRPRGPVYHAHLHGKEDLTPDARYSG